MSNEHDQNPTEQDRDALRLSLSSDGSVVLHLDHDGRHIQRRLSLDETFDLLGLVAGVLKQKSRRDGDEERNPVNHKVKLHIAGATIAVGTYDNGQPVIGVASASLPTLMIPLDLEAVKGIAATLTDMITWYEQRDRRN